MVPYQPGMMQYAMAPPVVHLQSEFVPNDYFIPTLVIAIVCPIVSFSTIFFTVAAIICSILVSTHTCTQLHVVCTCICIHVYVYL